MAQLDLFAAQDRALVQAEALSARAEVDAAQSAQAQAAARRNIAAAEEQSLRDMEAQALAHAAGIAAAAEARKNSAISAYNETGALVEDEIRAHYPVSRSVQSPSPTKTKTKAQAPARSPPRGAYRTEELAGTTEQVRDFIYRYTLCESC